MAIALSAVMAAAAAPARAWLPQDSQGWTTFTPSGDTRRVYVSSSAGNDNNSGLSANQPVRTLARAESLLRDNSADWMLLRRGDVWTESFGDWSKRGRSASEPLVIGAYGSGPRPLLRTGNSNGISLWRQSVGSYSNIAITGLHFHAHTNTGAWGPTGILLHRPGENLLIEDVRIEGYKDNIVAHSIVSTPFRNLQVRRSVIHDSFALHTGLTGGGHSQGIYVDNVRGILIEENVFDHNGHRPSVAGAVPTIYNHNLYIQDNNQDMVVRGNIIARGSSHGMQGRSGGVAENNLFMDNALAFFMRKNESHAFGNVVVHGSTRPLHPDGWSRGWGIDMFNTAGSTLINNVIAQTPEGNYPISNTSGVLREGNVRFNWGTQWNDPGPFPDESASIALYDALIGGAGSMESFLAGARQLSRVNWNPLYTAEGPNAYFRTAFGIAGPGDANRDGVVDIADLSILASNWQQVASWATGDFNNDGITNIADLSLLAANWQQDNPWPIPGMGSTAEMLTASVPEPAAAAFAALSALSLLRRRGRRI